MGIDLQSLSITSAFNSIISFFRSQENNSSWKDLTTGSEGIFLIRMLSNILTNISYKVVTARRENYLSTAYLLSSNIGISVNLGYSVFRGKNPRRTVQVTFTNETEEGNAIVIPKFGKIGTYNETYNILSADPINIFVPAGGSIRKVIEVIIGNAKSITFSADTSRIKIFTQFVENISEDYRLFVTDMENEIETTVNMKGLEEDKWLVRTNPYKSVDLLYLNNNPNGRYRYNTGTPIKLEYVELANPKYQTLNASMFSQVKYEKTLSSEDFQSFESVDEIKINAPIDHEVQNLIRSKEDYSKRFKTDIANVDQTSYNPITPTYTVLSYLKNNYTLVTDIELSKMFETLKKENYFGTPLPDVVPPRRYITGLIIKLALSNKYKDFADIREDIDNIIKSNYSTGFNQTFTVYDLERLIEGLSYVRYARVSFDISDWEAGKITQQGTIIKNGDFYYIATGITGTSGQREPNWRLPIDTMSPINIDLVDDYTLPIGEDKIPFYETADETLVWRAYKRLDIDGIKEWSASTRYKIGDYVLPKKTDDGRERNVNFMFKCVDIRKVSGTSSPDVKLIEEKDFLVDGSIVWVCKPYSSTYDSRGRGKLYNLGSSVNIDNKSFECIGYADKTGITLNPPSMYKPYYIVKETTTNRFTVDGNQTNYFQTDDYIKAELSDGDYIYYIVKESEYNNTDNITYITIKDDSTESGRTYTKLYTKNRGTDDGFVYWEYIDDIDSISYGWNVYNVFDYKLEVE